MDSTICTEAPVERLLINDILQIMNYYSGKLDQKIKDTK